MIDCSFITAIVIDLIMICIVYKNELLLFDWYPMMHITMIMIMIAEWFYILRPLQNINNKLIIFICFIFSNSLLLTSLNNEHDIKILQEQIKMLNDEMCYM